jgi:hypothetical protein
VAGGWAIDLCVGRETRPHGDIDVAVLRRDQPALQACLSAWEVRVAHDGTLTPWVPGDWLEGRRHQFWVRRPGAEAWSFEVLLEDARSVAARDDVWVYRRDPRIEMPLAQIGRTTPDGVPYLAPEIALLYKAGSSTVTRNAVDFAVTSPLLDAGGRRWLREALEEVMPGHPWTGALAE